MSDFVSLSYMSFHHSEGYQGDQRLQDHKSVHDLGVGPSALLAEVVVERCADVLHGIYLEHPDKT